MFVELSETFGVSVPSKSNYYIPDIVDSYSLKKEIVNKKWKSEKFQDDVNLIEYWEISDYSFIEKISRYIKLFFDRKRPPINLISSGYGVNIIQMPNIKITNK